MQLTNAAERSGSNGTAVIHRAAGVPSALAAITLVDGTRSRAGFSIEWNSPSDSGGSPITAYEVVDYENERNIFYFGS